MQLQYGIHDLNPAPILSDLLIKEDYHKASHILSSSITHQIPRNPSFSISGPFRASTALIHHSVIRELTVNQPLLSLAVNGRRVMIKTSGSQLFYFIFESLPLKMSCVRVLLEQM